MSGNYPRCHHEGPCFAKAPGRQKEVCTCSILYNTRFPKRKDEKCPFQKEKADVTNGRIYPFNEHYGKH